MAEPSGKQPDLFNVMVFATMISFGVLGAIIASTHGFFSGNISFQLSFKTILGFLIGCAAGWVFWWIVRRIMGKTN